MVAHVADAQLIVRWCQWLSWSSTISRIACSNTSSQAIMSHPGGSSGNRRGHIPLACSERSGFCRTSSRLKHVVVRRILFRNEASHNICTACFPIAAIYGCMKQRLRNDAPNTPHVSSFWPEESRTRQIERFAPGTNPLMDLFLPTLEIIIVFSFRIAHISDYNPSRNE
jgi:hypothetical protein